EGAQGRIEIAAVAAAVIEGEIELAQAAIGARLERTRLGGGPARPVDGLGVPGFGLAEGLVLARPFPGAPIGLAQTDRRFGRRALDRAEGGDGALKIACAEASCAQPQQRARG